MRYEVKGGKVIITAEKYIFEVTADWPPSVPIGAILEPAYAALTDALASTSSDYTMMIPVHYKGENPIQS